MVRPPDLFMKRWILLMKYCEVKTKKQIFLVFLKAHLSIEILLTSPALALIFHILFVLRALVQANHSSTIGNFTGIS